MATNAPVPPNRLTIEEFFDFIDGRPEHERWELDDGVPVLVSDPTMMAGGTRRYARVAGRLFRRLADRLEGSGCEAFNGEMLLRTRDESARVPDVAIYCDPRDLDGDDLERANSYPSVVFEVLSPSTQWTDRVRKLIEYKQIESMRAVVFVDAERRVLDVHTRLEPNEWRSSIVPQGAPLVLAFPAITVTADEIFGPA